MTLTDLFFALNAAGVQLSSAGDRLQLCPAEAVTPELRAAVLTHKPNLLALLPPAPATPAAAVPVPAEADADALELAEERAALQWEGALTGKVAAAVAARAVADWDRMAAGDWDQAEAEALVRRASDALDTAARSGALPPLPVRLAAIAALDAAGERHHMAALRQAAADFLAVLSAASPTPPARPAGATPGLLVGAVYDSTDAGGWRWFRIGDGVTREDAFDLTDPARWFSAGDGQREGPAPTPPAGVKLYHAGADWRPCSPAAAAWWTWEGAPKWYASPWAAATRSDDT